MGEFVEHRPLTATSDSSRDDSKRYTFTICLSVIAAITACAYTYYQYQSNKVKMAQIAPTNNKDIINNKDEKKEDNNLQKSSSSYYLYKSTNPEEAKKYAPKKLDNASAQTIENNVKSKAKGSSWNTGATMEQFDYSEWMKQRLEQLLKTVTFKNSQIQIVEVTKIDGSATILLTRGKYRPGYDISFECKWKGFVDPNYKEEEDKDKNENDDDE